MKFNNDAKKKATYWRGFVTGAMIGSGLALILAQRKNSEKWDDEDEEIAATEVFADDKDEPAKDALDETLNAAKKVAQEIKNEARDAWNETLDNVKKPAA